MKKISVTSAFLILMTLSCSTDDKSKTGNGSLSADSSLSNSVKIVKPDSAQIDVKNSSFVCTRSKTVKSLNKEVKIFGGSMNLKMDNASFSATTPIVVKDGYWYSLNSKFLQGKMILDMKSVNAVQIGKDERLEMDNPDYLATDRYPFAYVTIRSLNANTNGNAASYAVDADLTLKDTSASIHPENVKANYASAGQLFPSSLEFDFSIDGMKWGLNRKDAQVTKDELKFHVVMKGQ